MRKLDSRYIKTVKKDTDMNSIDKIYVDQLYRYVIWVSNVIRTNEYKLLTCDIQNTTNKSALPVSEIAVDI